MELTGLLIQESLQLIRKLIMTAKEYCIAFCDGYFYAQLGERLTNGKVTEHALDLAKETAQTCMEQQIAYSGFDEK